MKLGQYLSTRADVLPEAYISLLKQLQDSLPPRPLMEVMFDLNVNFINHSVSWCCWRYYYGNVIQFPDFFIVSVLLIMYFPIDFISVVFHCTGL